MVLRRPEGTEACEDAAVAWKPLPRSSSEPPVRVDRSLARVLRHLGVPSVERLPRLEDHWREAVGPTMAEHAGAVMLRHGRLTVRVDDPAWAGQLRWMEQQILERLRVALDGEEVQSLDIRVGPASA